MRNLKASRAAALVWLLRAGCRMTTDISPFHVPEANIYRNTIFKTQIFLLLVNPQVRKQWLPGCPKNCSAWNQCSEGKSNSFLESISSFIKGFLQSNFFLLGNQYKRKLTACCLSDGGCNQRVEQMLICSCQPLLSISRGVMKQVFCLRSSFPGLAFSAVDQFFKRTHFSL